MASLSLYLTSEEDLFNGHQLNYIAFHAAYGVSMTCLLVVNLLHIANLPQFSTKRIKIAHPLKRSRALIVIQCCSYLFINQLLETIIVLLHVGRTDKSSTTTYWLQILSILFSNLFYMWTFALYLINFYIARNLKNASYMLIEVYVYLIAYFIPLLVAGVIAILSYALHRGIANQNLSRHQIFWMTMLLAIRLLIIYIMTVVNTYAVVRRYGSLRRLKVPVLSKIYLVCSTRKIRNGVLLEFLVLMMWFFSVSLEIECNRDVRISSNVLYLAVVFHTMVGPYFLIFETLSYRKELVKGFRRQRRRKYGLSGDRFRSMIQRQVGAVMWQGGLVKEGEGEDEDGIDMMEQGNGREDLDFGKNLFLDLTVLEFLRETTL